MTEKDHLGELERRLKVSENFIGLSRAYFEAGDAESRLKAREGLAKDLGETTGKKGNEAVKFGMDYFETSLPEGPKLERYLLGRENLGRVNVAKGLVENIDGIIEQSRERLGKLYLEITPVEEGDKKHKERYGLHKKLIEASEEAMKLQRDPSALNSELEKITDKVGEDIDSALAKDDEEYREGMKAIVLSGMGPEYVKLQAKRKLDSARRTFEGSFASEDEKISYAEANLRYTASKLKETDKGYEELAENYRHAQLLARKEEKKKS